MKEKRFFCDFFEEHFTTKKFAVLLCILMVISCVISYQINNQTYLKELSLYSKDDYSYLNKIAENIWINETKALSFSNIPDDVSINDFNYDHNTITFKCTLDKNFMYISNPIAYVIISQTDNNIQILNPTKEMATNKILLTLLSICFGMLAVLIPVLFIYVITIIIVSISSVRKKSYFDKKVEDFK